MEYEGFDSFIAETYDQAWAAYRARVGPRADDVAFFVEEAVRAGGPVLEIGSGTGRILIPMARAGVTVVGLEQSPYMLEECMRRLECESAETASRVTLHLGNMQDFSLSQSFKLIVSACHQFQHVVSVSDQLASLDCVRRHMSEDAQLVVDVFNPSPEILANAEVGREYGDEPEFQLPDGSRVVRRRRLANKDIFNQINHIEHIYYVTTSGGISDRKVHAFAVRYFYRFEMEHLLRRSGFTTHCVYGDYRRNALSPQHSEELIFVVKLA